MPDTRYDDEEAEDEDLEDEATEDDVFAAFEARGVGGGYEHAGATALDHTGIPC